MSKRFTSFLVIAAAVLLALPTQAQVARKAAKSQGKAFATAKFDAKAAQQAKEAQLKAAEKTEGLAFRGTYVVETSNPLIASLEQAQDEKLALEKLMNRNFASIKNGGKAVVDGNGALANRSAKVRNVSFQAVANTKHGASRRAAGETVDANGIITAIPEGDTKIYQRTAGNYYYVSNQSLYYAAASGNIEITELEDGTVYFKDFFSGASVGTYIKGTKVDNKISVPAGQVVYYWTSSGYGLKTAFVSWEGTEDNGEWVTATGDVAFTLTVDEEAYTISLDATDAKNVAALIYTDDNSFSGYGDYESVFTYDPEFVAPELIELPAGAEVQEWYNNGSQVSSSAISKYKQTTAKVAFVGDEVYIAGLSSYFPDAWIKGTVNGTTVTFEGLQYVGDYGSYYIYATGANGYNNTSATLEDFQLTYDAAAGTLTSVNSLLFNAAEDRIYFLEAYEGIVISKDEPVKPDPVAVTGDPIDVLPYSNTFDTEDDFNVFGTIDANDDAQEGAYGTNGAWSYYSYSQAARYAYSSSEDADDWLVSPAIKLEAGKRYHFAIDARASSTYYAERFEVKLAGGEAKASVLAAGQQVIPVTDVTANEFATFENEGVTVSETGYYHFGIHAISDADMSSLYVDNFLVEEGADPTAPAEPTALTLTQRPNYPTVSVMFRLPTTKINGDALTAADITKADLLRDGEVIKTFDATSESNWGPGAYVSYIDDGVSIGNHTYQAISYGPTGIGGKSEEKTIFVSVAIDVPYTFDFSQNILDLFSVIDNNADGKTWAWNSSYGAYYSYDSNNQADDYLISLPVKVTESKSYKVTVVASTAGTSYQEKFEVLAGKEATVAGLTTTVIPEVEFVGTEDQEFEGEFTADADGQVYLAIHATSDPDKWRLNIKSITVEKVAEPNAPAAPTLAVQPAPYGRLMALYTITPPTKSVDGNILTEGFTKIELLRDDEVIVTEENVALGQVITNMDATVENGTHTYQAIAYNAAGGQGLKSEKVSVFVGQDELGPVQNVEVASTTATSVTLTWDQVTGKNGGFVSQPDVEYKVYALTVVEDDYYGDYLAIDEEVATVQGVGTATFDYPVDEGESGYKYFGVSARATLVADATESNPTSAYTYVVVGAPEELPIEEGFAGSQFHYTWNTNGGAFTSTNATDGDGVALVLASYDDNTTVYFQLDKVNLQGAANPTLLFDVLSPTINEVKVVGAKDGETKSVLATEAVTNEYKTVKVSLKDIVSGRSTVGFQAFFENYTYSSYYFGTTWGDTLAIDNIKIVDLLEYNLTASVSAPKTVKAGDKATITATVKNIGENAAEDYKVIIKAGDEELLNETVSEKLGSFESKNFTAELPTTIFTEAGDITITATVEYENDLDEDDDIAETIITVKESSAAQPENLTADAATKTISWDAPSAVTEEVTDDVESYDDNDNGGIYDAASETYVSNTGTIGEWTVYDGTNGEWGYGFNGVTSHLGEPASWIVFNPLAVDAGLTAYTAHSGDKYFISACKAAEEAPMPDTDNWLISPELPGVAQTISFYVRELVTDYGAETYEIWASSTDKEIASFTLVASKTSTSAEWEEVSVDLPAGTKYFAIRHTSNDVWALLVDDITYLQGGGEVASYNVYLDEELNGNVNVTSKSLPEAFEGTHKVSVTAVYANGNESAPVSITLEDGATAIESLAAATGKPVNVYTIDGKLVRQQTNSLSGLKGAYIVGGKKVVVK